MGQINTTGPDLSVIILTYNSLDLIEGCISSLLEHNDLPKDALEIIVVDNSAAAEGVRMKQLLHSKFGTTIMFIKNENNGYGQGNNVGLKAASGKNVLIMNPDVLLVEPIFSAGLRRMVNESQLALLGGRQLGGRDISFYLRPEYEFHLFTTPLMLLLNKLNLFSASFMFPSGAFLLIRKKAFEEISEFDENIFMYCEEADICRRFIKRGYKIDVDYGMPYKHLIDGREEMSDFSFAEAYKATRYYFAKYNLNFQRFIWQKKLSLRILSMIYRIIGVNKKSDAYTAEKLRFVQIQEQTKK